MRIYLLILPGLFAINFFNIEMQTNKSFLIALCSRGRIVGNRSGPNTISIITEMAIVFQHHLVFKHKTYSKHSASFI